MIEAQLKAPEMRPLTWLEHKLLREFRACDAEDQRYLSAITAKAAERSPATKKKPVAMSGTNVFALRQGGQL